MRLSDWLRRNLSDTSEEFGRGFTFGLVALAAFHGLLGLLGKVARAPAALLSAGLGVL